MSLDVLAAAVRSTAVRLLPNPDLPQIAPPIKRTCPEQYHAFEGNYVCELDPGHAGSHRGGSYIWSTKHFE